MGFLMRTAVHSTISQPFSPTSSHGVCAHREFSISRKRADLVLTGKTLSSVNTRFYPTLFLKLLSCFFFVYLIFSLFCSMFCTCYAISQKATALQQPPTDFFFSHIPCSLVQDRFYTAIWQDRCGCRGTCRYPQLWCLSVCPQWSSGYEPKIRGSPPSISQRLQRPKPGECLSQATIIRRGMKAGQETWGWKSSGKRPRCRQNLHLGVVTFY